MSKLIDLTNQNFGHWHVIERGPNDQYGKAYWLCECTLCGKTKKLVSGSHLRSGRSTTCGCDKIEKMRKANIKDETGKTYGFLYVNRIASNDEKPNNKNGTYWNCTCKKCGRTNVIVKGDYLRNGNTNSCGCLLSKNESIIAKMLDSLNYTYKQQYTFDDLTSTGRKCDRLLFDFAIFSSTTKQLLYLIEYDGIQHFDKTHTWKENGFDITRKNDLLKNQYCFEHNIPLIRIPYNKKYDINDIKIETTSCLITKDNENNYYNIKE